MKERQTFIKTHYSTKKPDFYAINRSSYVPYSEPDFRIFEMPESCTISIFVLAARVSSKPPELLLPGHLACIFV